MARRTKVDPEAIHVAVDAFTTDLAGYPETYQRGVRIQGSNPVVKNHPALFAREDDLEEIRSKRAALYAEVYVQEPEAAPAAFIPGEIPPEHRLVVTRDYVSPGDVGSGYGLVLHAGEIVDDRDRIIQSLKRANRTLFRKPEKAARQ